MTPDEIIEAARDAGFWQEHTNTWMCSGEDLTSFAALVRNAALEEAAVVCEAIGQEANLAWRSAYRTLDQGIEHGADDCADTIRKLKENQMTDLRKAAQQALVAPENLDGIDTESECVTIDVADEITALRAALAQPDVPGGVSADSQNPRDKDDVPLERAVLVREWKAMRLAISTPRSQPEGYVLVPVEPTEEMASAGARSIIDGLEKRPGSSWDEEAPMVYRAMLAAAPKGIIK